MNGFWVFLEAMAGILDDPFGLDGKAVEDLKREFWDMPQSERDRMDECLNVVSSGISSLATMDNQTFVQMARLTSPSRTGSFRTAHRRTHDVAVGR